MRCWGISRVIDICAVVRSHLQSQLITIHGLQAVSLSPRRGYSVCDNLQRPRGPLAFSALTEALLGLLMWLRSQVPLAFSAGSVYCVTGVCHSESFAADHEGLAALPRTNSKKFLFDHVLSLVSRFIPREVVPQTSTSRRRLLQGIAGLSCPINGE